MAEEPAMQAQEFEFRAEMKQLLHLIIHSLYTHREVFLRELISNASDALNKLRILQLKNEQIANSDEKLKIEILLNPDAHTMTIRDTGVGMTRDDLVERIGTVASSGTLAFLESMKAGEKQLDAQMIGQFGVGFYSAFMVADEITIETCHALPGAQGYRWRSRGEGNFTIESADACSRGTTITLHLKEDAQEFSEEHQVRQTIQKYSNFVDFPIFLNGAQVNRVKALWQLPKDEISHQERDEFYKYLTGDYNAPMGELHLHLEGQINIKALLFIPASAPIRYFHEEDAHGLHLYTNKVFVQDNARELLPEYLRFVRGVVDTEDLPLNVSREVTQSSPAMAKIRNVLTGKILSLLEDWAQNDADKYNAFFKQFGPLFKTGLATDQKNRDRITELLRFESTASEPGEMVSLRMYVDRTPEEQNAIYYLMAENRQAALHNPNLEYFKKHKVEVLLLTDPVDVFTFPHLDRYAEKFLTSIEKADLDLKNSESDQEETRFHDDTERLIARFKQTLGDRVEDVVASKRLVDSAATLVIGRQGLDTQMERMMKMMGQHYTSPRKILEINPAHPLLKNLARLMRDDTRGDLVDKAILQLFEGALLINGNLNQPASFVERMAELLVEATA